ncbi:type II secretion system minor pseudopilin GspH [Citrobacter sp. EC_71]|uniref:type II secretion system minor pseudopilin GspH n=1 Tax=unclassified Citrobacter TaxID=2644389 RepID=UPI0010C9E7D1|nr:MULTISPECIES: type II secretion system minor pseudopilin GspH [unclassified Citrobacter]MBW9354201.1 type II secretion system minor pseudopilin GspH [Citrobacter sp. EC_71]TKT99321.1 type II secretion system protein GspH [Citrobacter sp. wls830]TKV11640.1 type II secretion system protein GspH [Citrobacter sp. wls615]
MKQQQGFTLLEVLLVIVIIAMMAAGVIASQNSRLSATGRLSQQAEAFRQQVEYAADWALLEKSAIGLRITREGWSFWQLKKTSTGGKTWQEVTHHEALRLAGDWQSSRQPTITPPPEGNLPQLVITPDGEITPFTLSFRDEDNVRLIDIQSTGSLPLTIALSGKKK